MARTGKTGLVEELLELGAALPWWLSLVLAAVAYGILHHYAMAAVPTVTVPGQLGAMVVQQMVKTLAGVGQYLVPLLLLIGALVSVIGRHKRRHLVVEVAGDGS
jgi:restriction system protein